MTTTEMIKEEYRYAVFNSDDQQFNDYYNEIPNFVSEGNGLFFRSETLAALVIRDLETIVNNSETNANNLCSFIGGFYIRKYRLERIL